MVPRDRRWAWLRWLAWLLGLALAAWLVHHVGTPAVMAALRTSGPRLGWLVLAYAASTAVMALPWRRLLPLEARPPISGAIASRFAASGLNALLPLVGIGEVTRLLWLPPVHRPVGMAALIADRVMFAVASVITLAVGAAATLMLDPAPPRLRAAVLLAALVIALIVVPVAGLARRGRMVAGLQRLGGRMWRRVSPEAGDGAAAEAPAVGQEIDATLARLFRTPRELTLTLGVHLLARALAAVEIFAALRALGVTATVPQLLVLASVPVALALVGAFLPSQIGLQEGAQAAVAAALGLGATVGLTMVLLQRARQLLFVPVTAALLAARPHPTPNPSVTPP